MVAKDIMKDRAYSFESFKLLGKGEQYKEFRPKKLFDDELEVD